MAKNSTVDKPVKFVKKALMTTGVVAVGFALVNTARNRIGFVRQPIDAVRRIMLNGF